MTMNKLVVLRGIPGCGKSTFVRALAGNPVVCSADDFPGLYTPNPEGGAPAFNPALIGEAHNACFRKALCAVQGLAPLVVVDNTNTSLMEASPYVLMGQALGYDVEVVTVVPPSVEAAMARNTHGVPEHVVRGMADTLARETTPPWWNARTVNSE
jgi:predicted kinase